MNRQQFAETVANAYIDQFSANGSPVMNERIIVYDGENFGSQSSLTPVSEDETAVMSLEEGGFGDIDADDPEAEESIAAFLIDSASDEIWQEVVATIEYVEVE